MRGQAEFRFAPEGASPAARRLRRLLAAAVFGGLFLLPLFGWLAAEPTPYRDPAGHFAITTPEGWAVDDSGHMGPGLVAKGATDEAGRGPLLHLTHEPAGKVTLEVRWQTLLGQMRFEQERLKYLSIEDHEEATPPYSQALYGFNRGADQYVAVTRLVLANGRFYHLTGTAPEGQFLGMHPVFLAAFDSLRAGGGN